MGREVPDETHLDSDGLYIPHSLREFDRQVVIRTPRTTHQFFSSDGELPAYYGLVTDDEFGDPAEFREAKNPELAPDRVSIKPEGEDAVVLTVDLDPGIRPSGDDPAIQPDGGAVTERDYEWARRMEGGDPIVGWTCDTCGHEIEYAYQPSLLRECPDCGGNAQGVRGWTVEQRVRDYRKRLAWRLFEQHGPILQAEPTCALCGTTEDVHFDSGPELGDFEYRCDDCRRFPFRYWWQPGDHPALLTRDWIERCDRCGAEFTGVFGVTYAFDNGHVPEGPSWTSEDVCLDCVDVERLRRVLEPHDAHRVGGGDSA
jgi:predicted RNA-binding Zn-ribbon protein involved in translation (DUF1610 family)